MLFGGRMSSGGSNASAGAAVVEGSVVADGVGAAVADALADAVAAASDGVSLTWAAGAAQPLHTRAVARTARERR
jgi:hypothetical protein